MPEARRRGTFLSLWSLCGREVIAIRNCTASRVCTLFPGGLGLARTGTRTGWVRDWDSKSDVAVDEVVRLSMNHVLHSACASCSAHVCSLSSQVFGRVVTPLRSHRAVCLAQRACSSHLSKSALQAQPLADSVHVPGEITTCTASHTSRARPPWGRTQSRSTVLEQVSAPPVCGRELDGERSHRAPPIFPRPELGLRSTLCSHLPGRAHELAFVRRPHS